MGAAGTRFAYAQRVANWYDAEFTPPTLAQLERELRCLACGGALDEPLRLVGSLRCLECREANAPIDPAFVGAPPDPAR